jgi:hypothetical protein
MVVDVEVGTVIAILLRPEKIFNQVVFGKLLGIVCNLVRGMPQILSNGYYSFHRMPYLKGTNKEQ